HVVSTPAKMRAVLDTINSNNLQVVFDPVNFIDAHNFGRQDAIMQESFDLFGDRIAIIHAKDFVVDHDKYKQVRTGLGSLNYDLLMRWIKQRKPGISILLEDAPAETVDECVRHIEAAS